ncbi:hypothetical protein BDY19DRAFT_992363 [Irpex rosettiformis]|uniref:Uncharacterized protein n=1 Tax=Irpex rosettiformis TaxID=378272 RepID=A0ACB8U7G0_9APHY|nr:hypothetical protein BDY19DRAFT_992363 [Irpex rosettiformis]
MSTITARASFVIFKDEPSSPVKAKASARDTTSTTTVLAIVTAKDKENLHPITGCRSSTEDATVKKRKTAGVLATKLLKVSGKTVPESRPPPRKRKLSVSSDKSLPTDEKLDAKKKKPATTTTRKHKPKVASRIRKVTELPKVEEEESVSEEDFVKESSGVEPNSSQAAVDSKCYELTVLPLADVSKAFESSPPPEEKVIDSDEEPKVSQTEDEAEPPVIRGESTRATSEALAAKTPPRQKVGIFSTPERKRLYAAFTFATPSPASKRYASSRASSVDRFSDLDFDPVTDALTLRAL